jgi:hypothetical protein
MDSDRRTIVLCLLGLCETSLKLRLSKSPFEPVIKTPGLAAGSYVLIKLGCPQLTPERRPAGSPT